MNAEPLAEPATEQPSRRTMCAHCLRPRSACLCQLVQPVRSTVEVLILQHPQEVTHSKGSARLLHLCLQNSQLVIGETFAQQDLQQHLYAEGKIPLLLYPPYAASGVEDLSPPPELDAQLLQQTAQLRLVVLDASWRKSRKMLYLNPALQALPRYSLESLPESRYLIRKAQAAHQLSSLEACAYALTALEQEADKYAPLLTAFDGFVAQWRRQAEAGQGSDGLTG